MQSYGFLIHSSGSCHYIPTLSSLHFGLPIFETKTVFYIVLCLKRHLPRLLNILLIYSSDRIDNKSKLTYL